MVVGYVCESDPFVDRNLWSGTIFKIREAIENAGFEVKWIPFDNKSKKVLLCEKIRWKLYDLLGRKQILGGVHFLPELYLYGKSVKKDETFSKCDVLFFPRAGQIGLFFNYLLFRCYCSCHGGLLLEELPPTLSKNGMLFGQESFSESSS